MFSRNTSFWPSLGLLLLPLSAISAPERLGPNPYWPGDFETIIFAGGYSNNLNVTVTDRANRTPGGSRSWEVHPGYQHLEILIKGERHHRLSFWARCPEPVELVLKVISHARPNQTDGKPFRDNNHPISLRTGSEWRYYAYDFYTPDPYPSVAEAEILLTLANPHDGPAFIDDMKIREIDPSPEPVRPLPLPSGIVRNGDFDLGGASWLWPDASAATGPTLRPHAGRTCVVFGDPSEGWTTEAGQRLDVRSLAGRRIRLEADVAFLTNEVPEHAWLGMAFDLFNGSSAESPALASTPKVFWPPFCRSVPTGQFQTVSAAYTLPDDATDVWLRLNYQQKAWRNQLAVDAVRIVVEPN